MTRKSIGIITPPISGSGIIQLSNLITILYSISNELYLVTGNDGYNHFKEDKRVYTLGVNYQTKSNIISRILWYIYLQLQISYNIYCLNNKTDVWVFFFGECFLLPILAAKILRKKVLLAMGASSSQMYTTSKDPLSIFISAISLISFYLSDVIIIYTESLIKNWKLEKFKKKIQFAHEQFLDFKIFSISNVFMNRRNSIGYIGRFSREKGVMNFISSISKILNENEVSDVLIIGDGNLREDVENILNKINLMERIDIKGWVNHEDLPSYLNKLKLLVLPSHTEGLPNIVLEAMACGVIILTTPVGSMNDIIIDGKTGFIMKNNSSNCIAKNVQRVLDHPSLDVVSANAYYYVIQRYTFKAASESYKRIFSDLW